MELAGDVLQVLWRSTLRVGDLLAVLCSIRNIPQDGRSGRAQLTRRPVRASAGEGRSRMLRPRPCLYAAGTAGDMTCGICGPLRFGLTGDARGGGWFLALVVPEIPA